MMSLGDSVRICVFLSKGVNGWRIGGPADRKPDMIAAVVVLYRILGLIHEALVTGVVVSKRYCGVGIL